MGVHTNRSSCVWCVFAHAITLKCHFRDNPVSPLASFELYLLSVFHLPRAIFQRQKMRLFFFLQCAVFIHLCPRLSRARIRFCMCPRIQCAEPRSWVASLGARCQTGAASPSRTVWDDTWRLSERAPLLAFGYGVYHQHCCSLIAFHFCEDRAVLSLLFSFF